MRFDNTRFEIHMGDLAKVTHAIQVQMSVHACINFSLAWLNLGCRASADVL